MSAAAETSAEFGNDWMESWMVNFANESASRDMGLEQKLRAGASILHAHCGAQLRHQKTTAPILGIWTTRFNASITSS